MSRFVYWFVKITGCPGNWLYLRRKTYYKNKKSQSRKIKGPAIIISNHTALMDFPLYMYTFFGKCVRTLVAKVTYHKNKLMSKFLLLLGGIKVDRNNFDFSFMSKSIKALEKKQLMLIFPEARLPKKEEKDLLPFKPSFVYIALESNAPIIPVYTNGKYGIKGKTRMIIGEKIYANELYDRNKTTEENIQYISDYVRNYIIELREELNEKEKAKKK